MASGTYDSIPEEVQSQQSQSIVEEEIIDEVEEVEKSAKEDEISEESFLKESKQEGSAVR